MPVQPDLEWQLHLAKGRFMLCADATTGVPFYPPRTTVPGTGKTNVKWIEASGQGRVYSTTTIHRKPPASHINVALIDLKEGPRMMSRVDGIASSDVWIGMAVSAVIEKTEDGNLFVAFVPAEGT